MWNDRKAFNLQNAKRLFLLEQLIVQGFLILFLLSLAIIIFSPNS